MAMAASALILLLFWTPGVRLLLLWQRTREAPEGLLSGFFLCIGAGAAIGLYSIGQQEEAGYFGMRLATVSTQCTAILCLLLFTRRVFRPNAAWALGLVIASAVLFFGGNGVKLATGALVDPMHWSNNVMIAWGLCCMVWSFVECTLYWLRMRRQARMGLGDPVVRNRFLLWMIWTGAVVALPALSLSLRAWVVAMTPEGEAVRASVGVLVIARTIVASMGITALVAIALSFFPPGWYLRWVQAGEAEGEALTASP